MWPPELLTVPYTFYHGVRKGVFREAMPARLQGSAAMRIMASVFGEVYLAAATLRHV